MIQPPDPLDEVQWIGIAPPLQSHLQSITDFNILKYFGI